MSVYKSKNSTTYRYDFWVSGVRFHGSTGQVERRKAESCADSLKKAEQKKSRQSRSPGERLTLDLACDRYWLEVAQRQNSADDTKRSLALLVQHFGEHKALADITNDDIAKMVYWRRNQRVPDQRKDKTDPRVMPFVSAATVNRTTTDIMRRIFLRARKVWDVALAHEPNWSEHRLAEPKERVRELLGSESQALAEHVRGDYLPFFAFARATGLRLNECVLRWSEVNWEAGQIQKSGKGDRAITFPITSAVRAVLEPLVGHHPEFVFTYIAQRAGEADKGKRSPITYAGAKTEWRRLRSRAKLVNFRFHDFRHDFATRLLRDSGNLKIVQRALNHASIQTTTKYAHVQDTEVADAIERAQNRNSESHKKSHRFALRVAK